MTGEQRGTCNVCATDQAAEVRDGSALSVIAEHEDPRPRRAGRCPGSGRLPAFAPPRWGVRR